MCEMTELLRTGERRECRSVVPQLWALIVMVGDAWLLALRDSRETRLPDAQSVVGPHWQDMVLYRYSTLSLQPRTRDGISGDGLHGATRDRAG